MYNEKVDTDILIQTNYFFVLTLFMVSQITFKSI